jgi:hypothetical protein
LAPLDRSQKDQNDTGRARAELFSSFFAVRKSEKELKGFRRDSSNAGDHGVAKFNRPSLALPGGHRVRGLRGSIVIERSDSMTHFLNESFKRL